MRQLLAYLTTHGQRWQTVEDMMAGDSYSSQFPAPTPVGIDHENWIAAFLGASICELVFLAVIVQKSLMSCRCTEANWRRPSPSSAV